MSRYYSPHVEDLETWDPGTVGTSLENRPMRCEMMTRPALWIGLMLGVCLGCSNTSSDWRSFESSSKHQTTSDWYQLDSFAEHHLSVVQMKTRRLKDGTLVGQFEITNKTDRPITFKYKWLWLNSDSISLNHSRRREKVIELGADESRILQSRTTLSGAAKPLVRFSSFSSNHPE